MFSACAHHASTTGELEGKKGAETRLWLMARCRSYQRNLSAFYLCWDGQDWHRIAAAPGWKIIPGIGLCFSTVLPALSKLARALATSICNIHTVSVKWTQKSKICKVILRCWNEVEKNRSRELRHTHVPLFVWAPRLLPVAEFNSVLFPQFDMQRITLEELKHILYHAFRDHLTMKDIENIIINEEESLNENSGNCQTEFEGERESFCVSVQLFSFCFICKTYSDPWHAMGKSAWS